MTMTKKLGYSLGVALALTSLAAPGCDGGTETAPDEAKTYVLVHGAWMGEWAWDEVAADLESRGANVVTVNLPAHGDDLTPVADVSLATYADAVYAAAGEGGDPVILVGHSMAGMVISRVAEEHPDRVAKLVYLGAYLPAGGQSLYDLAMTDAASKVGPNFVQNDDGTAGINPEALVEVFCADCDAGAAKALTDNYRAEPLAPFTEPVTLTVGAFGAVKKVYIRTEQDAAVSPGLQDAMLAATPVDQELSIASSHSPFLSRPAELVELLEGL
jgi:pimeloyl-ACP methyl ester carboxylesterase